MKVHNSVNMETWRGLWKIVLLTTLVWAAIDFVSADEEATTEPPDLTIASTTEPGELLYYASIYLYM